MVDATKSSVSGPEAAQPGQIAHPDTRERGIKHLYMVRSVIQVDVANATSEPASSVIRQSVSASVRPAFTICPTAVRRPDQTGLRKLIFSSTVVNFSPSSRR